MTTIVLVDDHPLIRRGLKTLLEAQPDFLVVGETGNGLEAVRIVENLRPNITLLDLIIDGVNGIEVAKQLNCGTSGTSIVIFSMLGSEHYVLEALRAGVKGYVIKESPMEELIHALNRVAAGKRYLCAPLQEKPYIRQMDEDYTPDLYRRLTLREREVLKCALQGNTCANIADQLSISRRTVEAHRANMMRKLGFSSIAALYKYAFQQENILNQSQYRIPGKE